MLIRALLVVALLTPLPALAQLRWQEGLHYTVIANPTQVDPKNRKIEVTEVFSFGCIHCYRAKDNIAKLRAALPADAVMNYVHASFLPSEAWPMFQRAWYTAEALGIGEKLHDAMFVAIWQSNEIPLLEANGRLRNPLPTIDSAAKFYAAHSKVKEAAFLKKAQSPTIDAAVKRADELIKTWKIPGTPALVVNGRYLIDMAAVGSWDGLAQVVDYLVGLERQRLKLPPLPAKP